MRLENLYQNFSFLPPELQLQHVAEYRLRRAKDMEKKPNWPKKSKTTSSRQTIKLTLEEETVRKLLGLTKKQVIAMREIKSE